MFLALIIYGWAIIPFVYVQSFLCTVASSAYVWVTVFNIFSGKKWLCTVLYGKPTSELCSIICHM